MWVFGILHFLLLQYILRILSDIDIDSEEVKITITRSYSKNHGSCCLFKMIYLHCQCQYVDIIVIVILALKIISIQKLFNKVVETKYAHICKDTQKLTTMTSQIIPSHGRPYSHNPCHVFWTGLFYICTRHFRNSICQPTPLLRCWGSKRGLDKGDLSGQRDPRWIRKGPGRITKWQRWEPHGGARGSGKSRHSNVSKYKHLCRWTQENLDCKLLDDPSGYGKCP